jgi:hypothetical protein
MNPQLIFDIIALALSLVRGQNASVAGTLVQSIQKAAAAYQAHTGEALDPSLIKAEEPL